MNRNILIKLVVLVSIVFVSKIVFASVPAIKKTVVCPEGYICLKKDDPLIMASTSQCFKSIRVNVDTSKTLNQDDKIDNEKIPYEDGVIAYLKSINEDHVGIWNVFKPGVGSLEGKKEDYGFRIEITLSKPKTVKSITITNNGGNEGWSTSKDQSIFGKYPYPLVVFDEDSKQLNGVYDQSLLLKEGKTIFYAYGQIEVPGLDRPEIIVEFSDGARIVSKVSEVKPTASDNYTPGFVSKNPSQIETSSSNSIWSRIMRSLGF